MFVHLPKRMKILVRSFIKRTNTNELSDERFTNCSLNVQFVCNPSSRSSLLKISSMLTTQLDPLTEQQVVGIYSLQQSSQQAEEALTQGLDQLHQSLVDTIASGSVNDGVHHMAVALGKLTNLEGFVRQADNLRQQTLHQLHRILTVRQAAKCFLVISEYYGRLRALSSLWASRPRETLISDENSCQTTTDLQMVQSSHSHFSNFG
ncbi:putative transcription factor TGA like domain-containing protein [Helianthus anomalus]